MAREYRRGVERIKKAAESKGGKRFTRNIFWKEGDIHILAFLTAAEEIPEMRLHKLVKIPDESRESGVRYDTFVCRKDPSMIDETGGDCVLCDKVGAEADELFVAMAVELEAIKEGKKVTSLRVKTDTVKDKETGEEKEFPRWGLVMQKSSNFFSQLAAWSEAYGDIREVAWEIQREGGGRDTKYHQFVVMSSATNATPLPDLSEISERIPALEDLLEEMGSDEKYEQVADLAPGSQPSFGSKRPGTGQVPSGDPDSEFARLRREIEGTSEDGEESKVTAY